MRGYDDLPNLVTQAGNVKLELFALQKLTERLPQLQFDPRTINITSIKQIDNISYVAACVDYEYSDVINDLPYHKPADEDKIVQIICKYPFGDDQNLLDSI